METIGRSCGTWGYSIAEPRGSGFWGVGVLDALSSGCLGLGFRFVPYLGTLVAMYTKSLSDIDKGCARKPWPSSANLFKQKAQISDSSYY